MDVKREFGVVGLGRIGGGLAGQALGKGMRVVGFDLQDPPEELVEAGLIVARSLDGFRAEMSPPRPVFVYIPAGPAVDEVIQDLASRLEEGDIVIDGGNSYWGDSIRRHRRLRERGIQFVDLGTSGGVEGALHGACFMAGGEQEAMARVEPLLLELATEGGYVHAGGPGAGHFVKLVHNGIEFGMMQAIGEGVDLLENYREKLNIADVLRCWRHGSVIRSWLVDLMEAAYREEAGMDEVASYVDDTGEVNWLVNDAIRMEVATPVIAQSIMQLIASRDDRRNWARAIAMMRRRFGGHPYGPVEAVAREREEGRVGDFFRGED
ncbi:MAG: phosphogluconate dehydrogenase (NAD(+)-dependent, decarboxylating) [Armatimonadota bacterium]